MRPLFKEVHGRHGAFGRAEADFSGKHEPIGVDLVYRVVGHAGDGGLISRLGTDVRQGRILEGEGAAIPGFLDTVRVGRHGEDLRVEGERIERSGVQQLQAHLGELGHGGQLAGLQVFRILSRRFRISGCRGGFGDRSGDALDHRHGIDAVGEDALTGLAHVLDACAETTRTESVTGQDAPLAVRRNSIPGPEVDRGQDLCTKDGVQREFLVDRLLVDVDDVDALEIVGDAAGVPGDGARTEGPAEPHPTRWAFGAGGRVSEHHGIGLACGARDRHQRQGEAEGARVLVDLGA